MKGYGVLDRHTVWLMDGTVAAAIIGSLVHNAREFGTASVVASQNGEFPILVVWVAVFTTWWRGPRLRATAIRVIVAFAVLNLVGGAVISVLPLSVLPFYPEQSQDHYISHVFYGITQVPVIVLGIRQATTLSPTADE